VSVFEAASNTLDGLRRAARAVEVKPRVREIGRVLHAGDGIAVVAGLPGAQAQELIAFPGGVMGIAFNLDEDSVGCVLLGADTKVAAGDTVHRTGQVVRTAVGDSLLGRVVDPLGNALDGGPEIEVEAYHPIERDSPPILQRSPVNRPLAIGVKSIDAMIPVGRGQRELIIGDRSTGKTTIGIDAILSQRGTGVVCVYVAIGQQASSIARFVSALRQRGAMDHSVVVVADADSPPGMRYIAPYAGCTVSEYFMQRGRDTLIVYDDLTKHAETYREISLLLRRPPGREAYPGDIFYIHSRLLERATQLDDEHGGGSQTALPIIATQAQNISAYIPTNLISITDGQIYLSPVLFQSGFMPAVDIGTSVSRVGGKTQIPAMKKLAQQLRLSYTQFRELEEFTKFGTTVDPDTKRTLEKGRRLRELLKQPAHQPIALAEQALLLHLAATDLLMDVAVVRVREFEDAFLRAVRDRLGDLTARIAEGETLSDEDAETVESLAREVIERIGPGEG
jgi:F-type H+-transporting ATPase subunit alpha